MRTQPACSQVRLVLSYTTFLGPSGRPPLLATLKRPGVHSPRFHLSVNLCGTPQNGASGSSSISEAVFSRIVFPALSHSFSYSDLVTTYDNVPAGTRQ